MENSQQEFIKNSYMFKKTEVLGFNMFVKNFNNFDLGFIDHVFELYKVNYFKKSEILKFQNSSHDKLVDFIIKKIKTDKFLFSNNLNRKYLTISHHNIHQNYGTLLSFFSENEKLEELCDAILYSVSNWIKHRKEAICNNKSEENHEFYSLLLNLSNLVSNELFTASFTAMSSFKKELNELMTSHPKETLISSCFLISEFNDGHKHELENIDDINISRKKTISIKQLVNFNKDVLFSNPALSSLFEFEIRDISDFENLDEDDKKRLNISIKTNISKIKDVKKIRPNGNIDISYLLSALPDVTLYRILSRMDVTKVASITNFIDDVIRFADDLGYISDENIDYLELSYCS